MEILFNKKHEIFIATLIRSKLQKHLIMDHIIINRE